MRTLSTEPFFAVPSKFRIHRRNPKFAPLMSAGLHEVFHRSEDPPSVYTVSLPLLATEIFKVPHGAPAFSSQPTNWADGSRAPSISTLIPEIIAVLGILKL